MYRKRERIRTWNRLALMNRTYRKLLIVSLGAFVGSFLGWFGASLSLGELARREFEAAAGLEKKANGDYVIRPPYSPLGVVEQGIDSNEDGRIDRWALHALHGKRFGLKFEMNDTDFDGNADELLILIGPEKTKSRYFFEDYNGDGIADRISISITDTKSDAHHFTYYDLNLDGRIDVITEVQDGEVIHTQLINEYTIHGAKAYDQASRVFWVWTDQKTWETVQLTDEGDWVPFDRGDSRTPVPEEQTAP